MKHTAFEAICFVIFAVFAWGGYESESSKGWPDTEGKIAVSVLTILAAWAASLLII